MSSWRGAVLASLGWMAPVSFGAEPSLEPMPSPWDLSASARAGGGYKDNVLLAQTATESSAFSLLSGEVILLRAPIDNWEFTSVFSGEDRRYWQAASVDKEQLFFGTMEGKRRFHERWKAGINAQYFYTDQVFDASIAQDNLQRVRAQAHRISGGPSLEAQWGKLWVQLSGGFVRQMFEKELDSSWDVGPKLNITRKFGNTSELGIIGQFRDRVYDHREAPAAILGTTLGKTLHFRQEELEIGLKHTWDDEKQWKSRLRLGFEINEDNGSGHFDYRKYRISKDLTFTKGGFEGMLSGKFLHYEFLTQQTLDGTQARRRSEVDFEVRLKQKLTRQMSIFVESEYEWGLATDQIERYQTGTIFGGLEWSFE